MVQATRQLFSLLTLALTTLTTGYAAPTARAPSDCAKSLDQNVLLYTRTTDSYGTTSEYQLQLTRTPEDHTGFTEYVLIECPNGSCTSTPASLDWYLKDGALTPHQSDRTTIDLAVKLDSKIKFRMLGSDYSEDAAYPYCAIPEEPGYSWRLAANEREVGFWICEDTSITYGESRQVLWWVPQDTSKCHAVTVIARASPAPGPVYP